MQGLVVPQQNFPGLGNGVVVGLMFLLHVAIAEFIVGAITLAVIMEWRALRGGREREARYARGAANAYYLLFSLGVTLAVFAVSLLLGLWSNVWGTVVSVLLPLFAFAFGLFLLIAPLLVLYRNSWGRLAPRSNAWMVRRPSAARAARASWVRWAAPRYRASSGPNGRSTGVSGDPGSIMLGSLSGT